MNAAIIIAYTEVHKAFVADIDFATIQNRIGKVASKLPFT